MYIFVEVPTLMEFSDVLKFSYYPDIPWELISKHMIFQNIVLVSIYFKDEIVYLSFYNSGLR